MLKNCPNYVHFATHVHGVFELAVNIGLQMIYVCKQDRVIAMIKKHVKTFVFGETLRFIMAFKIIQTQ